MVCIVEYDRDNPDERGGCLPISIDLERVVAVSPDHFWPSDDPRTWIYFTVTEGCWSLMVKASYADVLRDWKVAHADSASAEQVGVLPRSDNSAMHGGPGRGSEQ